jgi:hypothetical protein
VGTASPLAADNRGFCVSAAVVAGNVIKASFQQRYCPPDLLGRLTASTAFLSYGTIPPEMREALTEMHRLNLAELIDSARRFQEARDTLGPWADAALFSRRRRVASSRAAWLRLAPVGLAAAGFVPWAVWWGVAA